jgi:uncharacterized protein YfcZ (UPF0381/DUF406 family)
MAGKVYRTAKGQSLDIGSLLLQQENTRAVGNMSVNARGDKINSENKIIKGRNEQMTQHYKKNYNKVVQDQPVYKSAKEAEEALKEQTQKQQPTKTVEPASLASAVDDAAEVQATAQPVVAEPAPQKVPTNGLAGAIAKARSVEQEEEKTARQIQQEQEGVKRI